MTITNERMEELEMAWDDSDRMDDQEYRDWYEELTPEERCLIDSWDKQYSQAFQHLANNICKVQEAQCTAAGTAPLPQENMDLEI